MLARLGHKVAAFEKHPQLYGQPRLCTIDGEAVRILGVAADREQAMKISSVCYEFNLVDKEGQLLTKVDYRAGGEHPSGHAGRVSFYQPDIEDAMDDAARDAGAEVNLGWAAIGIEQDASGVNLTVAPYIDKEIQKDQARTVRAKYLIGADGSNSFIRESVGIEREDFGYREAFLSIDVMRKRDLDQDFPELKEEACMAICDPGRTIAEIPMGPERIRFEFAAHPDENHENLMVREVGYQMLEEAYGLTADDIEIYRQVIYPFEGKLTKTWKSGRVLLAGDAAHSMPPFMGQGACSALRDSISAVWKIDLVLRGVSSEELLDNYALERGPHVKIHVLGSIALAELACERDPEKAEARNEMYRSGNMPPPPQDPTLVGGVLHRDSNGELVAPTGELAPQGIVSGAAEDGFFDEVVGWGFQLLARNVDPHALLDSEQLAFLDRIGCIIKSISDEPGENAVKDVSGIYGRFFDKYGVEAVLARPDFFTFAGAATVDEIPSIVDDLRAQIETPVAASAAG